MKNISVSTMWSLNYANMAEFLRSAREAGFTHVELNSAITPEKMGELLAIEGLRVSSIHAPCPNGPTSQGAQASSLSLGALNEDERLEAVKFAKATIDVAALLGAGVVILHAGYVKVSPEFEKELRHLYEQGLANSDEYLEKKAKLMETREALACPHVTAAKKSLSELIAYARSQGTRLALENRVNYHEIPNLDEMMDILREFPPDVIGYWHDVGHAEIQSRIGFTPHTDWFTELRDRILGMHLHDVKSLQDHYAPGTGDLDWDMIAAQVPEEIIVVCEIAEWNRTDSFQNTVSFLESKGII